MPWLQVLDCDRCVLGGEGLFGENLVEQASPAKSRSGTFPPTHRVGMFSCGPSVRHSIPSTCTEPKRKQALVKQYSCRKSGSWIRQHFFLLRILSSQTQQKNIIMVEFAYFMVEYPLKCVFCSSTMNTVKRSTQNTVNFEKHIKKGEQNNDDE